MAVVNTFLIVLLQTSIKLAASIDRYDKCDFNKVGSRCTFPCHCFASRCTHEHCRHNEKCEHPFFGYYCQYEDFFVKAQEKHIFASDDDHNTCYEGGSNSLQSTFAATMSFHFVSLVVKNFETVTETYKRNNITLNFKYNGDLYACNHQELWEISRTEVEIRCLNETIFFTELSLVGSSVSNICEIRLSGGRSAGTDLQVTAPDQYSDGLPNSVNGILNDETCFVSENIAGKARWEAHVSRPFNLYHIRLHNVAEDNRNRMLGFTLRLSDAMNNIFYKHEIDATYQKIYEIAANSTSWVSYITIDNPKGNNYISFCEAEVLGDCPLGKSGLDCEVDCASDCLEGRCTLNGDCYVCTREWGFVVCRKKCSGCEDSQRCHQFHGECESNCLKGYKGHQCLDLCANCAETGECDKITGLCMSDCVDGFMGFNCSQVCGMCSTVKCDRESGNCTDCKIGYFGSRCTRKCHQCRDDYCDHESGNCLKGCHDGYRGKLCFLECNNCGGSRACNQTTGACNEGCLSGYKGLDCTEPCGHCKDNRCGRENGTCTLGCLPGYVGHTCVTECSYCIDRDCDSLTAKCKRGCRNGYYGTNCVKPCPNCAGSGACDRYTGKCVAGCKPGFFKDTCTEECGNCAPDRTCKINGDCLSECLPGFMGSQCRDHKNDMEDSKKFTVFLFYAIFLTMVGITFILLFFSQKVYWFCSADSRESFENKIKWLSRESKDESFATTMSSFASSGKSSSGGTIESGSSSVDDGPPEKRPPTPPLSTASRPPAVPPPTQNIITFA